MGAELNTEKLRIAILRAGTYFSFCVFVLIGAFCEAANAQEIDESKAAEIAFHSLAESHVNSGSYRVHLLKCSATPCMKLILTEEARSKLERRLGGKPFWFAKIDIVHEHEGGKDATLTMMYMIDSRTGDMIAIAD